MGRRSMLVTCLGLILTLVLAVTVAAILQVHPAIASEPVVAYPPPDASPETDLLPPTSSSEAYPGPGTPMPVNPTLQPTIEPPTPAPTPISEDVQRALEYVTQRYGLSLASLRIAYQSPAIYPLTDHSYLCVLVEDTASGKEYGVAVDLKTKATMSNEEMETLEREARVARYGKLEPALYERLQGLGDEETLPVAIWIAAGPGQSQGERQAAVSAALAAKYPEARAAMEALKQPMDVSDPELRQRIEAEYRAMMAAQVEARGQPLLVELQRRGITVAAYTGMPSLTTVAPKRLIVELAQRADVSMIYLIEGKEQPALDSSVPTHRAPIVWGRG